jgi:hypothetical protein
MFSGDLDHLKSDEPAARASTAWPLGLMMLVVFVVCLAIWAAVITYFTRL